MKIEELEKTLLSAQQAHRSQTNQDQHISRASASSSVYSGGINREEEDDDDDGPILPVQPAPLRIPPPAAPPAASIAASDRPQSPFRGPTRRGPLPRRPGLEEYGVPGAQVSKSRGGTPTPASRSGSTDNYSSHSSPPSRTNTPQLRHPNWRRDLNPSSPAPTVDTFDRPRPSPVVDTGFNFDFGFGPSPGVAAPPTPDSTNWPLASPTSETGSVPPPTSEPPPRSARAEQPPAKFTRANVPPPLNLKFNFSPDAPSRDPSLGRNAGLWTPPLRSTPGAASTADGRPSTSAGPGSGRKGGGGLAASPRLISQFPEPSVPRDDSRPAEDDLAAFMGIGVARGPSIREVRRPGTAGGGRGPPMSPLVDSFGTGFI
ncbi:1a01337c-be71-45ef-8bd8-031d11d1a550 [Thermothielavioides terrestris]|nr:1a01337c-be71-45ef-8bd8-031d11d1a550 [Thermothielavioides terrestris]